MIHDSRHFFTATVLLILQTTVLVVCSSSGSSSSSSFHHTSSGEAISSSHSSGSNHGAYNSLCSVIHSCNGNADSVYIPATTEKQLAAVPGSSVGDDKSSSCVCICSPGYEGNSCNRCSEGLVGYPHCAFPTPAPELGIEPTLAVVYPPSSSTHEEEEGSGALPVTLPMSRDPPVISAEAIRSAPPSQHLFLGEIIINGAEEQEDSLVAGHGGGGTFDPNLDGTSFFDCVKFRSSEPDLPFGFMNFMNQLITSQSFNITERSNASFPPATQSPSSMPSPPSASSSFITSVSSSSSVENLPTSPAAGFAATTTKKKNDAVLVQLTNLPLLEFDNSRVETISIEFVKEACFTNKRLPSLDKGRIIPLMTIEPSSVEAQNGGLKQALGVFSIASLVSAPFSPSSILEFQTLTLMTQMSCGVVPIRNAGYFGTIFSTRRSGGSGGLLLSSRKSWPSFLALSPLALLLDGSTDPSVSLEVLLLSRAGISIAFILVVGLIHLLASLLLKNNGLPEPKTAEEQAEWEAERELRLVLPATASRSLQLRKEERRRKKKPRDPRRNIYNPHRLLSDAPNDSEDDSSDGDDDDVDAASAPQSKPAKSRPPIGDLKNGMIVSKFPALSIISALCFAKGVVFWSVLSIRDGNENPWIIFGGVVALLLVIPLFSGCLLWKTTMGFPSHLLGFEVTNTAGRVRRRQQKKTKNTRASSSLFSSSLIETLFLASGVWEDRYYTSPERFYSGSAANGQLSWFFAEYGGPSVISRAWPSLTLLFGITVVFLTAAEPTNSTGCWAQFLVATILHVLYSIVLIIIRPYNCLAINISAVASNLLLAAVSMAGITRDEAAFFWLAVSFSVITVPCRALLVLVSRYYTLRHRRGEEQQQASAVSTHHWSILVFQRSKRGVGVRPVLE